MRRCSSDQRRKLKGHESGSLLPGRTSLEDRRGFWARHLFLVREAPPDVSIGKSVLARPYGAIPVHPPVGVNVDLNMLSVQIDAAAFVVQVAGLVVHSVQRGGYR